MKIAAVVVVALAAIALVAIAGLRVKPRPWALAGEPAVGAAQVPVPDGLPAPVARYAAKMSAYGMPKVTSFSAGGTGVMRRGPLSMPLRWRVEHHPGEEFVRDMQVTWFGIPVVTGLDVWQHGQGKMVIAGSATTGPEMDQGANMAAWGEAGWAPSFQLTDPRVRWEPIDDTHARMVFPFEQGKDSLVYTFDPETDLPTQAFGMRYKAGGSGKIGWTVRTLGWRGARGMLVPTRVDVKWADEGEPWASFEIEDLVLNVPTPRLDSE